MDRYLGNLVSDTIYYITLLQVEFPSGLLGVSFDVGQGSLKLDLSPSITCLMDKPFCISLTLKRAMSHTIGGKSALYSMTVVTKVKPISVFLLWELTFS